MVNSEARGFEPLRPLRAYWFSRPAHSSALARFLVFGFTPPEAGAPWAHMRPHHFIP